MSRRIRRVAEASAKVRALPGQRLGPAEKSFFGFLPDRPGEPPGLLPMLTLGVCAPEVVDFGRAQGFDAETAGSGLQDLGQQAHVHRLATGSFGLFSQWWLTLAWGGSLWWFGRLQYNLIRYQGEYWLSVHIPQTGLTTHFERAKFAHTPRAVSSRDSTWIPGCLTPIWLRGSARNRTSRSSPRAGSCSPRPGRRAETRCFSPSGTARPPITPRCHGVRAWSGSLPNGSRAGARGTPRRACSAGVTPGAQSVAGSAPSVSMIAPMMMRYHNTVMIHRFFTHP